MFSFKPRRLTAALVTVLASATMLSLIGCTTNAEDFPTVPSAYSYDTVLVSVSNNVIFATYTDLALKGAALQTAVTALNATPNEINLHTARQAWRDARAPWESSEGFLFGPVDEKGIDPSIDDWPLDSIALKNILTVRTDSITTSFVAAQETNVKGFHAIEYLLFGVDSNKTADSLTVRQRQYLAAAASYFKIRVDTLKTSWAADGENFLAVFQTAGKGSLKYTSGHAAAEELLDGMIGICDEVANGKITDPYNDGVSKEESRFSRNSTVDFANNIRSVRNVYLGVYGSATAGVGVKTWVMAADTALALQVEAELDTAIARIEAVGQFSTALTANRPKIVAARTAIQKVKTTLEGRVKHAVLGN